MKIAAAMTPGFAGADLANIVNEAALLAARRGKDTVGWPELQEAVERVIAGIEKKNRVLGQKERDRVAHHEIGYALAGMSLPGSDEVHKVPIIPRGGVYVAVAERRSIFDDEIRVGKSGRRLIRGPCGRGADLP